MVNWRKIYPDAFISPSARLSLSKQYLKVVHLNKIQKGLQSSWMTKRNCASRTKLNSAEWFMLKKPGENLSSIFLINNLIFKHSLALRSVSLSWGTRQCGVRHIFKSLLHSALRAQRKEKGILSAVAQGSTLHTCTRCVWAQGAAVLKCSPESAFLWELCMSTTLYHPHLARAGQEGASPSI